MKRTILIFFTMSMLFLSDVFAQESVLNRPVFPTPDEVRTTFANGPGKDFATAPLWVWNDDLSEAQIRETLGDLASQGVLQAIVHPRPGLMTPYLSDDWFRLWRVALDEAARLGMNLWIYDENSYPSGFAGGLVPEAMPESRGRGLAFREVESLPSINNDVLFIWKKTAEGFVNVTDAMKAEGALPQGEWLLGIEQLAASSGWYGGKFYVDLLKTGVTEKFLEVTHEAYRQQLGDEFGKGIRGVFTDEPRLRPGNGQHWTEDLPAEFAKRYGFSLIDVVPLLQYEIEQKLPDGSTVSWQTVRHHYYQTLTEMMIDRWCRPNFTFCEKNGLEWTGHYWEHEWPTSGNCPDTMAFSFWHQRPAIDMLMNGWSENVRAQFGNNRAVRELRSAANQAGRARTLSETYGAGGWDLRFCDMKRIADWQYALGINTVDEHLSFISIRGARKHDHPQSFSRAASWWPMYHAIEAYHTRLSYLMSQGEQRNQTLVLQPTTTVWMYEGSSNQNQLGQAFANFCRELDSRHMEYDLGSEDILRRVGSVEEPGVLTVGHAHYTRVVLPAQMENLNAETVTLLNQFLGAEGELIRLGQITRINGVPSEVSLEETARSCSMTQDEFFAQLDGENFIADENQAPLADRSLFFHRRMIKGGEILFLCNIDPNRSIRGRLPFSSEKYQQIEQLDPLTGSFKRAAVEEERLAFDLPSGGSLALLATYADETNKTEEKDNGVPTQKIATNVSPENKKLQRETLTPVGDMTARRLAENALVIDYAELAVDGETSSDYFNRLNDTLWKKRGFRSGNPWSKAVQFRDNLIRHEFADDSGFTVTYRFTLDPKFLEKPFVERPLAAVVESANWYDAVTLNDKVLDTSTDARFLDRDFVRIELTDALVAGENRLTLSVGKMTLRHEIMPIILLGDFALKAVDAGFIVEPSRTIDPTKVWTEQGLPFYSDRVEYAQTYTIEKLDDAQYWVSLGKLGDLEAAQNAEPSEFAKKQAAWNGAVARVLVNGVEAGIVFNEPCEVDVTALIVAGENRVTVETVGTPKNLFGPHHAGKMRGRAWPDAFTKAPPTLPAGDQYDTIPYGRIEPFTLDIRR